MTFTLELPEDLARRLEAIPEGDWNRFAVAALNEAMDNYFLPSDTSLDPETIARLHQAFAAGIDDSVTVSLEDYAKDRGIRL